jgi:hypothetical protein
LRFFSSTHSSVTRDPLTRYARTYGSAELPKLAAEDAEADARAFFEANYAGRWGMSPACEPEGMFTLTADRFALYETVCDITELGREGGMVWGRTAECTAEGEIIPARTISIRATGADEITLEDGHYDWTRFRCGSA